MNRLALQHFSMQTYKELKSELDSYVEDRNIDSYKDFHNLNIRRNNDPDRGLENTKTFPNGICFKCILNSTKNQSDLLKWDHFEYYIEKDESNSDSEDEKEIDYEKQRINIWPEVKPKNKNGKKYDHKDNENGNRVETKSDLDNNNHWNKAETKRDFNNNKNKNRDGWVKKSLDFSRNAKINMLNEKSVSRQQMCRKGPKISELFMKVPRKDQRFIQGPSKVQILKKDSSNVNTFKKSLDKVDKSKIGLNRDYGPKLEKNSNKHLKK